MKKILFSLFFLNVIQITNGQNQNRIKDSLIQVLETVKEDTTRVNVLISLSNNLFGTSDYDRAISYAKDALSLSEKTKFNKGLANSYSMMGLIYNQRGNYSEALKNHFASLRIDYEFGYKKNLAYNYNNIGNSYFLQSNYSEALKNYFAALKILEEINEKKGSSLIYNNIGNIYYSQDNESDAMKNYLISLKLAEESDNKQGIANAYLNIGNVYEVRKNYSEALKNYLSSLVVWKEIGNKESISKIYGNIGNVYADINNYSDALKNYLSALKIAENIGDKEDIASYNDWLGKLYSKLLKQNEANKYFNKSLALYREIGSKDGITICYDGLAKLDSIVGNYRGAYHYKSLYSEMKDSIFTEKSSKQISQLKVQYESEKREKELMTLKVKNELQIQKTRTYIVLILTFSILLISGFWFQSRGRKRKLIISEKEIEKKNLELKNKDLFIEKEKAEERSKVQEEIGKQYHDNLGSKITSLLFMCENEKAELNKDNVILDEFASRVSLKLREIAEMNRSGIIALDPETEELDSFIAKLWSDLNDLVETAGKEIDFTVPSIIPKIKVQPGVRFHISSIMKEAINNSIKYSGINEISVQIEINDSHYVINIKDHGIGIDMEKRKNNTYGFKNMKSRIESIGGTCEVISKLMEGTTIRLEGDISFVGETKMIEVY